MALFQSKENVCSWVRSLSQKGISEDIINIIMENIPENIKVDRRSAKDDILSMRCHARTMKSGACGQCENTICDRSDQDLCQKCHKKYLRCSTPCTWKNKRKVGLFLGKIDDPIPIEAADGGGIAVVWSKEVSTFERYETLWKSGVRFHPNSGRKNINLKHIKKSIRDKPVKIRKKSSFNVFMSKKRPVIKDAIKGVVAKTLKHPKLIIYFLADSSLDVPKTIRTIEEVCVDAQKFIEWTKRAGAIFDDSSVHSWDDMCDTFGLDNQGDCDADAFCGRLVVSETAKLGGFLWRTEDKSVWQLMVDNIPNDARTPPKEFNSNDDISSKKPEQVDEESEESEGEVPEVRWHTLKNGEKILVSIEDDETIYNISGAIIGKLNRELNKMVDTQDDDEAQHGDEDEGEGEGEGRVFSKKKM